MSLKIRTKKSLFVAYPWDMYIQNMYEEIFKQLFNKWEIRHGSKITFKNPNEAEVEEFINRNKNLYDIFASAITNSDFFIADVTKTNPNVMLELGIAIQLNKNVLIVTSEKLDRLPFDIKGFRVSRYKDKNDLVRIIKKELNTYTKIKNQSFKNHYNNLYYSFPHEGELTHGKLLILPIQKGLKNVRFRCEYKFLTDSNSHDWFGVHMRAQTFGIFNSELIYSRNNQLLESVSYPGQRTPEIGNQKENKLYITKDNFNIMEIVIEGNSLRARTPFSYLVDDNVLNESLGKIALHAYAHNPPTASNLKIKFRNVEVINLDTISTN